jgi:hypothetical protein
MDPHCRKPLSEACIIYKLISLPKVTSKLTVSVAMVLNGGGVRKPFSSCICLIKETYQGKKINLKTVDKCYCYKFRLGVINKMSTTQKLLFPAVDGMQNMP